MGLSNGTTTTLASNLITRIQQTSILTNRNSLKLNTENPWYILPPICKNLPNNTSLLLPHVHTLIPMKPPQEKMNIDRHK